MLKAFLVGGIVFAGVYLGLRLIEYTYHRLRKTRDWSPHWGSWLFALLAAAYFMFNELGK